MRGSFLFDAVVIGGGPAGSIAALLLSRLGWSVALVERRPRHRGKTCGHCLSPRVTPLLASLGLLPEIERLAAGRSTALRVHIRGAAPLQIPLTIATDRNDSRPDRSGLVVERSRFDQQLIDRAAAENVTVFQPASARLANATSDGAVLDVMAPGRTISLTSGLLVGADGLRSGVARSAGMGQGRTGDKYGFSLDIPCTGLGPFATQAIHMFVDSGGYLGAVNQGGTLHLAALVGQSESQPRDPRGFCRRMARRFPVLAEAGLGELHRDAMQHLFAAGPMPFTSRQVSRGGLALVGDAAGYVEPFTGEGMSWAIESAAVLADVAADCRRGQWSHADAVRYVHRWRRRIGARQRACRWIALALERPRVVRVARAIAGRSAAITRRVVERVVCA